MRAFLREILVILIVAIVIFFLLQIVFQKAGVNGYCMEPGLQDGQQLLINKVVYYFHEPERGDVIILHPPPPYSPKELPFIKRIIALPGDTIEVKNGAVYVNGLKLDEPYIKEPPAYNLPPKKITENEYFVLGDNRNNTSDSHNGWTVPRQNIIGKAWLSIWPLSEWGLVQNYPLNKQLESSSASSFPAETCLSGID